VKDLHMSEWWLTQTPTKEFIKQSLQQNFQILWLHFSCTLKNNLHWSKDLKLRNFRYICRCQDLTKDASSMAHVALHFAHLVPEDRL